MNSSSLADEPLVWYHGSGTSDRRYLLADERGSIVAEVGASVAKYTYDPFGAPAPATGGGRFRYTGQAWLPEIALHHYKARAYSPRLGRFLQTDPILYDAGPNLYAYVGNDPVNRSDPTGTCDACSAGIEDWLLSVNVGDDAARVQALSRSAGIFAGSAALGVGALAAVAAPTIIPWFYANAANITTGTAIVGEAIAPGAGTGVLAGAAAAKIASAERTFVIGSKPDVLVAQGWAGHEILSLPRGAWSAVANDAWVNSIIAQKGVVYIGSPINNSTLLNSAGELKIFGRELAQFMAAGYPKVGDYLIPPPGL